MGLSQQRPVADHTAPVSDQPANGRELGRQPRVLVRCVLCGTGHTRVVCSKQAVLDQQASLERFYRTRWALQNSTTATDRTTFTQDYAAEIVACTDCGLLYRNPRPLTRAVADAYQSDRYDEAYLRAEFEAQRAWAATKIPGLSRRLTAASNSACPRVLEVGSFVGGFLAEGLARGWDMVGVDPGKRVAAFCRERRLPVYEGQLGDAGFRRDSFDAVVVWNTFDQLPDPHRLLHDVLSVLRDGGLLVVRVPNGACFDWVMSLKRRLSDRWTGLLDVALAWNNLLSFPYLYGYSVPVLTRLMDAYGFRVRACVPDRVTATPSGQLALWAAWEERGFRWLWRAGSALWSDGLHRASPWIDVYFERSCDTRDERQADSSALGVAPVYSTRGFADTVSACRSAPKEGGLR